MNSRKGDRTYPWTITQIKPLEGKDELYLSCRRKAKRYIKNDLNLGSENVNAMNWRTNCYVTQREDSYKDYEYMHGGTI
jgi:hypothetical protein